MYTHYGYCGCGICGTRNTVRALRLTTIKTATTTDFN
jgi:hypothetical protein